MSDSEQTLTYHALGVDQPLQRVGIAMLIDMTALVLDDPDEAADPLQKVANEVASTIVAKAGYGVDTEEPGDVLLVDVDAVSWHETRPRSSYARSEDLIESVQARRDWMIPDLEVPQSALGELKARYRDLVHKPGTPSEAIVLLHETARALGWSQH